MSEFYFHSNWEQIDGILQNFAYAFILGWCWVGLLRVCFCKFLTDFDWCQNFISAQYLENYWMDFDKILHMHWYWQHNKLGLTQYLEKILIWHIAFSLFWGFAVCVWGYKVRSAYYHVSFCPHWRGILLSGHPCIHPCVRLFNACHILWIMHARVLKLHLWIPHGKLADLYFFLVRVMSLSGVMPLWKIRIKSCQQDISKHIWAHLHYRTVCQYTYRTLHPTTAKSIVSLVRQRPVKTPGSDHLVENRNCQSDWFNIWAGLDGGTKNRWSLKILPFNQ